MAKKKIELDLGWTTDKKVLEAQREYWGRIYRRKQKFKYLPKLQLLFAWYDIWIGFFWDSKKKWLYVLPLPMVGLIIKFNENKS